MYRGDPSSLFTIRGDDNHDDFAIPRRGPLGQQFGPQRRSYGWGNAETALVAVGIPWLLDNYPAVNKPVTAALSGIAGIYATGKYALPWLLDWLPHVQLTPKDELYEAVFRLAHKNQLPLMRYHEFEVRSRDWVRTAERRKRFWWPNDLGEMDAVYAEKLGLRFFTYKKEEAWNLHRQESNGTRTLRVFTSDNARCFIFNERDVRPLDTVDLDPSLKADLLRDIQAYLDPRTRQWYSERGIPYRRGYLFHGPPGTGKTSLSAAIAGYLALPLYLICLSDPGFGDAMLNECISMLPKTGCILLLEDIDSAGLDREVAEATTAEDGVNSTPANDQQNDIIPPSRKRKQGGVTLSGLLNALDGVTAPEGHVLIMTTNNPENLDPALRRPGRIDRDIQFTKASRAMAQGIFKRMVGPRQSFDVEAKGSLFAARVPSRELTPAEIQGYLLTNRDRIDEAIEEVEQWLPVVRKEQEGNRAGKRRHIDDTGSNEEDEYDEGSYPLKKRMKGLIRARAGGRGRRGRFQGRMRLEE